MTEVRLLLAALLLAAAAASAQTNGFFAPKALNAPGTGVVVVKAGEIDCYTFTLATAREVSLEVSGSATSCVPVEAELELFRGTQKAPQYSIAESLGGAGSCAKIVRRYTSGSYKVCMYSPFGVELSAALRYSNTSPAATPSNDTCGTATLLTAATGTITSSTRSARNDHSPMQVGTCLAVGGSRGPDRVWAVDLLPGQSLSASLDGSGGDATLYATDSCSKIYIQCVAASQVGPAAQESIAFTNNGGATKRYYVVVDSKEPTPLTSIVFKWTKF